METTENDHRKLSIIGINSVYGCTVTNTFIVAYCREPEIWVRVVQGH